MQLKVIVIQLCDANGHPDTYDVITEYSDNICVSAVDANGVRHQFDSTEAYHLDAWAKKHGFIVKEETHDIRELLATLDNYADKESWKAVVETGSKFMMPQDIEESSSKIMSDRYAGKKAREYFTKYPSKYIIGE